MLVTLGVELETPGGCDMTNVVPPMVVTPLLLKVRTELLACQDQVNTNGRGTEAGLVAVQLIWKELFEDDLREVGEMVTPSGRSGEEECHRHTTSTCPLTSDYELVSNSGVGPDDVRRWSY